MKLKRRKFLKNILYFSTLPGILIFDNASRNLKKNRDLQLIKIAKSDLNEGLNQFEKILVIKKNSNLTVLSRKCTHLGCSVRKNGEALICPCHGSKYNGRGEVTKGPANRNLRTLNFKEHNGIIKVYI